MNNSPPILVIMVDINPPMHTNFKKVTDNDNNGKTGFPAIDSCDLDDLICQVHLSQSPKTIVAYKKRFNFLARQLAKQSSDRRVKLSNKRIAVNVDRKSRINIVSQSAMMDDSPSFKNHDPIQYVFGDSPDTYSAATETTKSSNGNETMYSLDDFFSRPVSIYDDVWAIGDEQNIVSPVWDVWSSDPSIRAKFANYAYFRGDLHVRVSITGTPFHYGRALVTYHPFAYLNNCLRGYDSIGDPTNRRSYLNYLSQGSPSIMTMDFADNKPLEFSIPFCSPKEAYQLINPDNDVIINATQLQDFGMAGQLRLNTLNVPRVADADTSAALSINVTVWATNVQLSGPTATNMDIVAQAKIKKVVKAPPRYQPSSDSLKDKASAGLKNAGMKVWDTVQSAPKDEYQKPGPAEQIASAVTDIGNKLADVPYIGGFAKATAGVAASMGKVFNFFGWAKPVVLTDAIFVKDMPFTNGSTTSGKETTHKLSSDPKQERTVDPTLAGGSHEDELAIATLANRETYLTTFQWTSAQLSLTTTMFQALVTPTLSTNGIYNTANFISQPTTMAFVAYPFTYWRGDITFRLEVVCSKFHRGKFLVYFEPNMSQHNLLVSLPVQLNQQTGIVVDIQECQDLEFTVQWSSDQRWKLVDQTPFEPRHSSGALAISSTSWPYAIGFIRVVPFNELVEPSTSSPVEVNVYVKCANLEVAVLRREQLNDSSTYLHPAPDLGIVAQSTIINPTGATSVDDCIAYFGEKIVSFRSLLKRYSLASVYRTEFGSGTIPAYWQVHGNIYPRPDSSYITAPTDTGLNKSLYNYLRYAFLAMSGGVRYRLKILTSVGTNAYVTVTRDQIGNYDSAAQWSAPFAIVNNDTLSYLAAYPDGATTYHMGTNGGIEFEMPYYSNNLWQVSFDPDEGTYPPSFFIDSSYMSVKSNTFTANFPYNFEDLNAVLEMATAEDFNFSRFTGAPYRTIAPG